MQCEDLAARLTDFFEGDLTEADEAAALDHLATCENCERVLAETRAAVQLARDHGRPTIDDDDRRRLFADITTRLRPDDGGRGPGTRP
jgi:anti-sigma factor RsiW